MKLTKQTILNILINFCWGLLISLITNVYFGGITYQSIPSIIFEGLLFSFLLTSLQYKIKKNEK